MRQWMNRAVDFLGLKRNIAALLGMVVLVGLGERMAEDFLPVYVRALGGTVIAVGGLNAMDNLLSALYSFPGGYLSDRLGYKRALTVFNLVAMLGYLIVILIPTWPAVLAGSALFLSWSAISLPATMSMVARSLPDNKRTMGVSMHSLVRRVPMALGPVLGGIFIAAFGTVAGMRLAFSAALIMALVSLFLQQRFIEEDPHRGRGQKNPLKVVARISPELWNLLVSDILVRFCEQIPYAFVVLWCLRYTGTVQFGVLRTIEMATAILVYVPVAWLADRSAKKPFVVATFVFFALFPLVLLYTRSFAGLAVAFALRGLKEFGEPTRKALIIDLAPEDEKASVFGAYYLIRDMVVSVAAFGGAFLWRMSPTANLLAASAFGLAGTVYFLFFGRDLGTSRAPAARV